MDLYLFTRINTGADISVFIDDEMQHADVDVLTQQTLHIGDVKKGQKISVCAVPAQYDREGVEAQWLIELAQFHEESYAAAYESLSQNVYQIETEISDVLRGTIHVDEAGIMMTSIQATDGMKVYVDDALTDYETIADTMIGVPLEAGDHVVEFRYEKGLAWYVYGISIAAFGVFLFLCLRERQREKSA
jgi:uncharacterized membrane protein YfhO